MNFRVVMSGGCRAKCHFCTDPMNRAASRDYVANLAKFLVQKPEFLKEVSVSGGEPTTSPDFPTIMPMLRMFFPKVVLTTNGENLGGVMSVVQKNVNHVNISRHGRNYEEVLEIFKTRSIPDDNELRDLICHLNKAQVDVNFNHVYHRDDENINLSYILDYIRYAKHMGASSVTFRHDHSTNDLGVTNVELEIIKAGYQFSHNSCPVCRTFTFMIDGMKVNMKTSKEETINDEEGIHEIIYHINGKLTADWAAEKEVAYNQNELYFAEKNIIIREMLEAASVARPAKKKSIHDVKSEPQVNTLIAGYPDCGGGFTEKKVQRMTGSGCGGASYLDSDFEEPDEIEPTYISGCGGGGCGRPEPAVFPHKQGGCYAHRTSGC